MVINITSFLSWNHVFTMITSLKGESSPAIIEGVTFGQKAKPHEHVHLQFPDNFCRCLPVEITIQCQQSGIVLLNSHYTFTPTNKTGPLQYLKSSHAISFLRTWFESSHMLPRSHKFCKKCSFAPRLTAKIATCLTYYFDIQ